MEKWSWAGFVVGITAIVGLVCLCEAWRGQAVYWRNQYDQEKAIVKLWVSGEKISYSEWQPYSEESVGIGNRKDCESLHAAPFMVHGLINQWRDGRCGYIFPLTQTWWSSTDYYPSPQTDWVIYGARVNPPSGARLHEPGGRLDALAAYGIVAWTKEEWDSSPHGKADCLKGYGDLAHGMCDWPWSQKGRQ